MRYYSLLVRDEDNYYYPQFGDYKRNVVEDEQRDSYKGQKCRIIKSEDDQASLDAAIAQANRVFTEEEAKPHVYNILPDL